MFFKSYFSDIAYFVVNCPSNIYNHRKGQGGGDGGRGVKWTVSNITKLVYLQQIFLLYFNYSR